MALPIENVEKAEQGQIEEHRLGRLRSAALADEEHPDEQCSDDERHHRRGDRIERPAETANRECVGWGEEPVSRALDQREDDTRHTETGEEDTRHIEAANRLALLGFPHPQQCPCQRQRSDRQVDVEGPPPGVLGRQPTTQEGPDRSHAADHRTPHTECDTAVAPLECGVDGRERRRENHGSAHSLQQTGDDQRSTAPGTPGQHAGNDEHDQANDEQTPAPVDITELPEGDEQRGEHQ